MQGFPEKPQGLDNLARAYAKFASVDPYQLQIHPQVMESITPEERKSYDWRAGIIPAKWLIEKIADSCEWLPAPIVAREMYCRGGFRPADGIMPHQLDTPARRRSNPSAEEVAVWSE